ncbi:MAG: LON peptidase substrate-binding domain-containing protein, partial [Myxococcota bacterium]
MKDEDQSEEESTGLEIHVGRGTEDDSEESSVLPSTLPILPLKNTVLFPYLLSPLLVNTSASQCLIDEVLARPDRLMVCTAVKNDSESAPGPDDVYAVGTVLRIVKMLKFPDDSYRLLVQGVARVKLAEFTSEEPFLSANIERIEESGEDDESVEMTALIRTVAQQFSMLVSESSRLSDELQVLVANLSDPSKLSDLVASNLDLDVSGKQEILEAEHVGTRLRLVLYQLSKETEALQIETEIKQKVQNEMGKTQREYMLRQQLEAIRRELGESEDDEEEVERLR